MTDPRPRLVSQQTGEVKIDRNGQTVYQVGLSAADATGRVELVNVSVSGEPQVKRRAGRRACRAGRVRLGADPQRRSPLGHRLPRRRHHARPPRPRPQPRPASSHASSPAVSWCWVPWPLSRPGCPPGHATHPRSFWLTGSASRSRPPASTSPGRTSPPPAGWRQAAPLAVDPRRRPGGGHAAPRTSVLLTAGTPDAPHRGSPPSRPGPAAARTRAAGQCGSGCAKARCPPTTQEPPNSSPTPGGSTLSGSPLPRRAGSGSWPPGPTRSPRADRPRVGRPADRPARHARNRAARG